MKAELVNFYGSKIFCLQESNRILVVVKTVCDGMGLDADRAIKTISDDEILGTERVEHLVEYNGDQPRKMICLPLEFLTGWLFQIKFTNTMSEETKNALIRYKRECYRVLFNYFFGNIKKQLESNSLEIELLKEINLLTEEKGNLMDTIKDKKRMLDKIRAERLNNEPTLF